ncbi:hypothetical protein [Curvivirga sp.]|uniref:hypothetical protein n=1 Tax=Curvivirga sp. TaxID=2856848 RepID=UPI003B5C1776
MHRILYLAFIFLGYSISTVSANSKVSLVVDVNEDIEAQVKLVQCVFEHLPEELDVVEMPWKRGQIATQNGSVDGFFIAARSDERDSYASYSDALREIKWIYILHKENELTPDHAYFYEARFGSSRGTRRLMWLQNELKAKNIKNDVEIVANATQGISELRKDKFDILLSNGKSYEQALRQLGANAENFKTYPVKTISGAIYFGHIFLKRNPDFLARFNKHTAVCRN